MSREVMQQALDALLESVDAVRHEYQADWRHGMPTRKAQLDGMRQGVEAHEAAIAALRAALAEQPAPVVLTDAEIWTTFINEYEQTDTTEKNTIVATVRKCLAAARPGEKQ